MDAVLQFLDRPTEYFQVFFSDYKRPALSLAVILGVVMTYRVLDSMLDAIDEVGLRGLFQLVGLFYTVRFLVEESSLLRGAIASSTNSR